MIYRYLLYILSYLNNRDYLIPWFYGSNSAKVQSANLQEKKQEKKSADLSTVFEDGMDAIAYTNIHSLLFFQRRWLCQ